MIKGYAVELTRAEAPDNGGIAKKKGDILKGYFLSEEDIEISTDKALGKIMRLLTK